MLEIFVTLFLVALMFFAVFYVLPIAISARCKYLQRREQWIREQEALLNDSEEGNKWEQIK